MAYDLRARSCFKHFIFACYLKAWSLLGGTVINSDISAFAVIVTYDSAGT